MVKATSKNSSSWVKQKILATFCGLTKLRLVSQGNFKEDIK